MDKSNVTNSAKVKYSVIVPVYNGEKTIARCIDSLVCPERKDYEIIIVNDGSSDNSKEICLQYCDMYPQVVYIEKENEGVSSARNIGLNVAKGEYITFLDSDDYIRGSYFDKLDGYLCDDFDFLMFGKIIFDGQKEKLCVLEESDTRNIKDTIDLVCKSLISQTLNFSCNKIFRADIINRYKIRFDEDLAIGEDKVFVVQYIMHISNARFINDPLYVISIENSDSLSRKKRENLCEQILKEQKLIFETVENSKFSTAIKKQLLGAVSFSYYRSAYTVMAELRKFDYDRGERLLKTKEICMAYSVRRNYVYSNWKHWLFSLPIRFHFVALIDLVLGIRKKI